MRKFGLIGKKLGHSYSPLIHGKFADYEYELIETEEDNLMTLIESEEYGGFNVTIPYKKTVMDLCDEVSERARNIGSINTVVRSRDGKLKGYNTDYDGFIYLLEKTGISPEGKKCLVLGSGGASLTVQAVLRDLGASQVLVVSRSGEINYENVYEHDDAQIIINTTPVGMYPENGKTPVTVSRFPKCEGVLDLIYNPNRTKLVLDAMDLGIHASGGLEMLVAQAKVACELFTGFDIEEEVLENVLDEVRRETLNAILIGMPGAGKTTLGAEMAERQGREFVDIDEEIEAQEGMSIPEIFASKGEAYFRKIETEMLEKVCIRNGLVIATGGGVVKNRKNYYIIRQNGTVIWVKRNLDKLATDGRPVSMSMPLEQIYEERKEAYKSWSDYFINNNEERD
ncbi:MAG: shikimate kinase [Eubacteriaceae bacterium]|nr:shikimate kinase [Eubacteriaceae bacterium]